MKKISIILFFSSMGLMASESAWPEDVYVITGSSTAVSPDDVKDVFLGEKQVAGSVKLTPVDNASLKAQFLDKAMHLTPEKYNALWVKKGFRDGINPPPTKSSDLEIISLVKSNPGTVGYVSKAPADVKVIKKY